MTASLPLLADGGTLALFLLAIALGILWVVTLFLIVVDDISAGSKLLWFLFTTLLAPIGIPVYLFARRRRTGAATSPAVGSGR